MRGAGILSSPRGERQSKSPGSVGQLDKEVSGKKRDRRPKTEHGVRVGRKRLEVWSFSSGWLACSRSLHEFMGILLGHTT